MAEVGYNFQDSTLNEFFSSGQAFSLAKSRAFALNAGDVFNAFHMYANSNQGSNADVSFWLYTADGNGLPVDYVSGPHTLNIATLDNSYAVRSVTGLSVNIAVTGNYTILANNSNGFRIARGATAEEISISATPPTDPMVESSTQTWDVALWGEYTAGSSNLTDDGQSNLKGKTVTHGVTPGAATGTIRYMVGLASANATDPTEAQIVAGLNQDTTAATFVGTPIAPADTNGESFTATGLAPNTAYKAYAVWDTDDAGAYSNIVSWTFATDDVGFVATDIRDPVTPATQVSDSSSVTVILFDQQPDAASSETELVRLSNQTFVSGSLTVNHDNVGDTGDTGWYRASWIQNNEERFTQGAYTVTAQ